MAVIRRVKVRSGFQNSEVSIESARSELAQLAARARSKLKNRKIYAVTARRMKRKHVNQNTGYNFG